MLPNGDPKWRTFQNVLKSRNTAGFIARYINLFNDFGWKLLKYQQIHPEIIVNLQHLHGKSISNFIILRDDDRLVSHEDSDEDIDINDPHVINILNMRLPGPVQPNVVQAMAHAAALAQANVPAPVAPVLNVETLINGINALGLDDRIALFRQCHISSVAVVMDQSRLQALCDIPYNTVINISRGTVLDSIRNRAIRQICDDPQHWIKQTRSIDGHRQWFSTYAAGIQFVNAVNFTNRRDFINTNYRIVDADIDLDASIVENINDSLFILCTTRGIQNGETIFTPSHDIVLPPEE